MLHFIGFDVPNFLEILLLLAFGHRIYITVINFIKKELGHDVETEILNFVRAFFIGILIYFVAPWLLGDFGILIILGWLIYLVILGSRAFKARMNRFKR